MGGQVRLRDQFAALERAMRDWELVDSDRFSFEDSDRFEEDSLCSWISEPESLCNNWRGWKKSTFANANNNGFTPQSTTGFSSRSSATSSASTPLSLVELSALCVASHIPFEMVERFFPPVPEQLQLRIAFWSFPEHEEDIRLYSCLANGSADEFQKGEKLFRTESVSDILQIGFHLSATVKPNMREAHKVAITFDRRRVTSCTCSCNATTNWCGHVVSVCLHRIFQSKDVTLRAPVSESLSRLHRDQLQKFAQYLISELPQQILPTAQRLLDELLSSQRSAINTLRGAPDPTAGASANEQTPWYLDERTLHGNIHKILIKFCVPAPIVFSDVNYLSNAAPPASAEWSSLLRPLRGREPEGMWNLLSIVREMFRREDRNAIPLLEVITEECLNCDQILVWWFNTKVALHNGNSGHGGKHHSVNSNSHACQHAGASLCDEAVQLWRLGALNPSISPDERATLHGQFKEWHLKIIEKVSKSRNASVGKHANSFKNDVEIFTGFRPAIEACYLNWDDYSIPGITYSESSQVYMTPFMCFRHLDGNSRSGDTGMIHSSHAILNNSAAISSVPHMLKRPRSVDFGGVPIPGPSTSTDLRSLEPSTSTGSHFPSNSSGGGPTQGPSKGKKGGKSKGSSGGVAKVELLAIEGLTMSASGLKLKEKLALVNPPLLGSSLEQSSSFEEELPTSGSSSSKAQGGSLPLNGRHNSSGNRSSVSSEGFCENEIEVETFEDPCKSIEDEGVDMSVSRKHTNVLTSTTTSDELEIEDSDSSESPPTSGEKSCTDPERVSTSSNGAPKVSDSSDSTPGSGDEYQLYYYDPKSALNKRSGEGGAEEKKEPFGINVFANLKLIKEDWELLFARAEGLHAHGHSKEACKLGVKLAGELLAHPPNLTLEPLPPPTGGKGKRKKINPASHQISCLASATLAKCGFLCTVLAENPEHYYLAFRVGMFGLELSRPPASTKPLEVKLANQEAELALLLKRIPIGYEELKMIRGKAEALRDGTFKSRGEALLPLVLANFIFDALVMPPNKEGKCALQPDVFHLPTDEALGFDAAVAGLGLKANVSEAEHPLLCEGTRRQRGDLALSMLLWYKDEPEKLARVMDKLLDREIHQLYKISLPLAYYSNNPPTTALLGTWAGGSKGELTEGSSPSTTPPSSSVPASSSPTLESSTPPSPPQEIPALATNAESTLNTPNCEGGSQGSRPTSCASAEAPPPANGNSNTGGAATSSNTVNNGGNTSTNASGNTGGNGAGRSKETGRYKGKRNYPVLPNQPSEAGAHFMFELAKIVLGKAGGSSNQSLFTQPSNGQNPRGPHRALHMCAFHIGLYALGLHNAVSPNWLSRTYSSHVSWITGQAMEIGAPAIAFLIDTWESHLTPPEAVTIADRASRGDANMVRAASELALSCLPFAPALNPNEIHRAILQCKEQSDGMLEKSCLMVESAAKGGGVYPEVLFDVARQWFSLYQKHLPLDVDVLNDEFNHLLNLDGSPADPLNHNGQAISAQTGLPPLGNNPPPPPPNTSGGGGGGGGPGGHGGLEIIQLPPPPPGPIHNHPYPQGVPLTIAPYVSGGSYPAMFPAGTFPVVNQGNFVYGQLGQVIYQGGPSVPTTSAPSNGFYPNNGQMPNPPQSQGYSQGPPMPMHSHNSIVASAGPALQYYPIPGQMGRTPQFFPMNLNLQGPHHLPPQFVQQQPGGSQGGGGGGGVITSIGCPIPGQGPPPTSVNGGAFLSAGDNGRGFMQGRPQMSAGPHQGNGPILNMNHNFQIQIQPQQQQQQQQPQQGHGPEGQHGLPPSLQQTQQSAVKVKYLLASYRVGMLAMETLARRVHDDRPAAKFARNPTYGEDVKWLLSISRKLGAQYLQQFCMCAVSSISNPFVLHEIILDATHATRNNLTWVYQNPRSPLAPLVQKCQQMYFQCLHQKLYHITLSDYEDFVNIVITARQALYLTPDGVSQFKEWLQNLRRSKACKKDLWAQITQALQNHPGVK